MTGPTSPLPPTVEDRDAEIAALQTAFDEYIASSRELEDELDAELAKMQEKLAESSAANSALISQLESLNPQLSSLEKALSESKLKLESESKLRRAAELAQDEAESRAREAESSLESLRTENDEIHEQLAFREEEVEEMRLELEVEKERHNVETEELHVRLNQSGKGGNPTEGGEISATNGGGHGRDDDDAVSDRAEAELERKRQLRDNNNDVISVMSGMTIETRNGLPDTDDDYIKRLEDELEDVTEQLIEAETNISDMESKLADAEKVKVDLEVKVEDMENKVTELQTSTDADENGDKSTNDNAAQQEELALLTEELALTQEELKAAEEDTKAATQKLEDAQRSHKEALAVLQGELEMTKSKVRSATKEVESLEKALNEANTQTVPLREEVENLMSALENAKKDHEKTIEEMEELRRAFDGSDMEHRQNAERREEDLMREHELKVKDLESELEVLRETNNALKEVRNTSSPAPALAQLDLQIQLEQTEKELVRAKKDLEETRAELKQERKKVEALTELDKETDKSVFTTHIKELKDKFSEESDEESVNPARSEYYRTHARSRTRTAYHSSRARSSSPSTVERFERDLLGKSDKLKLVQKELDSLKKQKRMSDVRVTRLEEDVSKLHTQMAESGKDDKGWDDMVPASVPSNLEKAESRDDNEGEINALDINVEEILSGDKENLAKEFRTLAIKANSQKEHNAQLLVKILKLQGNIQVCCRIRPLTNGEIKRGDKRVVENLTESEVGCFDSRTKSWKSYAFDKVWGPDTKQASVFQDVEPMALSVVDGYNSCIFAYGQTGSGKTFTMEGTRGADVGISYRTIEKVFSLLNYRKTQQSAAVKKYEEAQKSGEEGLSEREAAAMPLSGDPTAQFVFSIKVGMLEIYNDGVYDLLVKTDKKTPGKQNKKALDIKRDKNGQIEVAGLVKEPVNSISDVLKLLKRGNESRATAATDLNEHSSRSHMVLSVEVTSGIEGEEPCLGNLFLVDLAGSERVRKSAVEGQNLKEATHINKSLAALGNVMEALDRKASHVPYRDSKLTYLLQDSLGGNSRTMMVVAVCPTSVTFDETQHALQFATRVRRIHIGSAKRNVTSKNLEETVKALSSELKMLAKAKNRSEEQLVSLKRDHQRIQDRLKSSSESRAKAQDEARTLTVLKQSNTQMTQRWQKEKQLHDKAVEELESINNEYKKVQHQFNKVQRENDRLAKAIQDKEADEYGLKEQLRKAKDASSAAKLRERKATMLQSRPSEGGRKSNGASDPTSRSSTKPSDISPEEAREKVLTILKENDPGKVDKIDAIMERFQGRESFLLMKMASRYNKDGPSGGGPGGSSRSVASKGSGRNSSAAQKRSEMALARHMERMRNRNKSERSMPSTS